MRRTTALALLLTALLGLAACGDDGEDDQAATTTTAAPTTTTEEPEVFDPDAADDGDDGDDGEPSDDDEPADDDEPSGSCSVDQAETNEATVVGDLVDCVLPDLADDVTGANFQFSGNEAQLFVSGDIDVTDALQVCEVVTAYIDAELTEYDEVVLTITTDSDVVGETGTPLVTATDGDGSCEPA